VQHVQVRKGDFSFIGGNNQGEHSYFRSNRQRSRWEIGGPYFHGHNVYAMAYDARGGQQPHMGFDAELLGHPVTIQRRFRQELDQSTAGPPFDFPPIPAFSLKNIWQITLGRAEEPKRSLLRRRGPPRFFETRDAGENLVARARACSIIRIVLAGCRAMADWPCTPFCSTPAEDQRMYVAISSGGVLPGPTMGGRSWTAQNRGIRAMTMAREVS